MLVVLLLARSYSSMSRGEESIYECFACVFSGTHACGFAQESRIVCTEPRGAAVLSRPQSRGGQTRPPLDGGAWRGRGAVGVHAGGPLFPSLGRRYGTSVLLDDFMKA